MGKKARKKARAREKSQSTPRETPSAELGQEKGNGILNAGRAFLIVATGLAIYLTVVALSQGSAAGCEEGSSCDSVLNSKWSKIFGVPVGIFGGVAYLALLGESFTARHRALRIFLAVSILGGALWFSIVQGFILHTFCPWCCTTHVVAAIGAILVLLGVKGVSPGSGKGHAILPAAGAVAALAVSGIIQWQSPEPVSEAATGRVERGSGRGRAGNSRHRYRPQFVSSQHAAASFDGGRPYGKARGGGALRL